MRRVLLDTDILSEILKGKHAAVVKQATNYALEHGRFTLSAVTVSEILFGLVHRDARRQLRMAELTFNRNEVVVPSLEDFKVAGRTRGMARRLGYQLTTDDCLIGAIASRMVLPVATGNTEQFAAMGKAGLQVPLENWKEP